MDNNFLPIPSPFEMGVDLNVDRGLLLHARVEVSLRWIRTRE
jgi:hypothetical protein